jgi:hypothetical protein
MKIKDISLDYSNVKVDFLKKELQFDLAAQGTMVPIFDSEAFKAKIAGDKKDVARSEIEALPQLENADIKLWPAWLGSLPKDLPRIALTVQ